MTLLKGFTQLKNTRLSHNSVASTNFFRGQKIGRAKIFDFRRKTLFCL